MLHPGRVVEYQSARSCCACRSVVVRLTRRRRKSCPCAIVEVSSHTSSTWSRLWPCRSSEELRTTCGFAVTTDLRSSGQLYVLLASPHCVRCTADWIDFRNVRSPPELAPGSGWCCCSSSALAVAATGTQRLHRLAQVGAERRNRTARDAVNASDKR